MWAAGNGSMAQAIQARPGIMRVFDSW